MLLATALAALLALAVAAHIFSVAAAIRGCRRRAPRARPPQAPMVSIVRPVCGIENHLEATLRSGLTLDYPNYEVLFCLATADDPALPLIRRLIAAHPQARAQVLIGNEALSPNPKLNNVAKGWRAAASDWIVMADSNVLMPPDYLQRLLAAWRPDTGAVSSPVTGGHPNGFAGELECAFLNTYAVRWQYAADVLGAGFAQGKSMLLRRDLVDACGGLRALALDLAEDAAVTKLVRGAGLRVRLVEAPFLQPLGQRSFAEVWRRQMRWARLRRGSFPHWFALEILTGGLLPLLAAVTLWLMGELPGLAVAGLGLAWYGGEALLARAAGWPLGWRWPLVHLLRDLLLPAVWLSGWAGAGFVWRGNAMRVAPRAAT